MKIIGRVLLTVFIIAVSATSCSPKFMKSHEGFSTVNESMHSSSEELLSSYKANINAETVTELPSPLEKEKDGLRYILESYFNIDSTLFIGEENKEFLDLNILNNPDPYLPITAENWEKIIKIIFSFGDNDDDEQALKMYIRDFVKENRIERQHAVSGLMKLLSFRYRLSLGGDAASLQKSEIIPDLNNVDDKHQGLIRQAYCLGFTDFSVDKNRLFRPFDYLSNAETVSMLYRILSNLGMPVLEQPRESDNALIPADDEKLSEIISNVFSVENILLEYNEYKADLSKNNKSSSKKRLEMLQLAEEIIGTPLDEFYAVDRPLRIEQWAKILNQVFGLESEDIDPYLNFETDGTLPYDIVAISVMKASNKLVGYGPRDATEKELEEARAAIPQFDTARDISKFAQMFSSGLLEGLYFAPGFTPQRPVNEVEALLLVKRITECFRLK